MNILITVDYQGDFANPTGKLYVQDAETIANNIQKNIDNKFFEKHIMTFDTHMRDQYFSSPEYTDYNFDIHCEFGADGWKPYNITPRQGFSFISAISTVPSKNIISDKNEYYFLKDKFDIWTGNENFEKWVETNISKSDNIFIQGVATNYCVFMNAIGFKNRGYNVFIIEDAVKGIRDDTFDNNVKQMKDIGIEFINIDDFEIKTMVEKSRKRFKIDDVNKVIYNLKNNIREYVFNNKLSSLVIGVSGGLDSAVVAALCKDVGVPVFGVSIPINSTEDHREKAKWVGKTYCTYFKEISSWDKDVKFMADKIKESDDFIKDAGFTTFSEKISEGNLKARLRMITLYDIARKTNGMVMSTDNYSEFNMGFWTLHGDVGDYGLIQNINKGFELPQIAKALGIREDIISQPPSDGLNVTSENTDEAQLGASYSEIDAILEFGNNMRNPKIKKIINRYNEMKFKRNGVINLNRDQILNFK